MLGNTYQDRNFEPDFIAPFAVVAICPVGTPVNGHVLRQQFMTFAFSKFVGCQVALTIIPKPLICSRVSKSPNGW